MLLVTPTLSEKYHDPSLDLPWEHDIIALRRDFHAHPELAYEEVRTAGIVAERFGVKTAIVSGGVLCVVSVAAAALFLPKFINYDGRKGVRQREIEEAERAEMLRVSEGEF